MLIAAALLMTKEMRGKIRVHEHRELVWLCGEVNECQTDEEFSTWRHRLQFDFSTSQKEQFLKQILHFWLVNNVSYRVNQLEFLIISSTFGQHFQMFLK